MYFNKLSIGKNITHCQTISVNQAIRPIYVNSIQYMLNPKTRHDSQGNIVTSETTLFGARIENL